MKKHRVYIENEELKELLRAIDKVCLYCWGTDEVCSNCMVRKLADKCGELKDDRKRTAETV